MLVPNKPIFSPGLIFTTAQVAFITAKIDFIFMSLSAFQIYDFHIYTVINFINNQRKQPIIITDLFHLVKCQKKLFTHSNLQL